MHEAALALETLERLRDGDSLRLPRFDKLTAERLPLARWPPIRGAVDVMIFEGWFLKTPAQRESELAAPVNALERDQDPTGAWRA